MLKLLSVFFVFYVIALYVYRIYFDPLSSIPGPKLAAASHWYEFYYDVIKKGKYTWKIWEMHDKYGKHMITMVIEEEEDKTFDRIQAPSSESALMRFTSTIRR